MNRRLTGVLAASASFAALNCAMPVRAQSAIQSAQASEAQGGGLEEIVVTARRREEKAQTVPIALTNFTPEALQKQDIRSASELSRDVPGLVAVTTGSVAAGATFLRGVPGVIAYFAQIPTDITSQNQSFFFDVGSIQVLKGPQGTLFGLSNDAGAILYEPNRPASDYEGYVQGTVGNYSRTTIEGVVNLPVVADKLLIRVGGQYQRQDGYEHVIAQNVDLLNQNYWTGRISATFRPADDFQNDLLINYFDTHYRPGTAVFTQYNPAVPQAFAAFNLNVATLVGLIAPSSPSLQALLAQQQKLGNYTVAALNLTPNASMSQLNIVDTASWDIADNLTIKNIFGYQETNNGATNMDIDGLPLPLLEGTTPLQNQASGPKAQYNEELQLLGKAFDDKLTFVVGTFNQLGGYATADTRAPYGISYTNSFGQTKGTDSVNRSRTDAVYMQGTYDLGDYVEGLSVTLGGRYSWDKFYTRGDSYTALGVLTHSISQSANFRSPSYTISVDYQWRPQTMFYITDSRGYKTGGFNDTNGQVLEDFGLYRPEHLNNYEAGVKTDFDLDVFAMADVKGRFNFSGYYGVYSDIAVQDTAAYAVLGAGAPQIAFATINVGSGDIYGYDGEITLIPDKAIELNANFAYSRGRYNGFLGPNAAGTGQVLIPGVEYENNPLWKFNLHGTYHFPIDEAYGDVSLTASYSWTDRQVAVEAASLVSQDYLPAHDDLDMTLDWKSIWGKTGLDARLFVNNLLENHWADGGIVAWNVIGILNYQPAAPRMYGLTVRYAFGGAEKQAEVAATYAAPPVIAPVPATPGSYLVFFDFNKSDLSQQALSIVDLAAKNAAPAKVTQMLVIGHTDTVGSDAYNMRLSRRRAESVSTELEKQGIPSGEIEIVAKGKRDLLVPTGDGVREPQNRRVQIVYSGERTS